MAAQAQLGNRSPEFILPAVSSGTLKLSDLRGQKVVIKYYPKYDTPGSTKEACSFRDALPGFFEDRCGDPRDLERQRREARRIRGQVRVALHAGVRLRGKSVRGL
jgi:hypothetical protein